MVICDKCGLILTDKKGRRLFSSNFDSAIEHTHKNDYKTGTIYALCDTCLKDFSKYLLTARARFDKTHTMNAEQSGTLPPTAPEPVSNKQPKPRNISAKGMEKLRAAGKRTGTMYGRKGGLANTSEQQAEKGRKGRIAMLRKLVQEGKITFPRDLM